MAVTGTLIIASLLACLTGAGGGAAADMLALAGGGLSPPPPAQTAGTEASDGWHLTLVLAGKLVPAVASPDLVATRMSCGLAPTTPCEAREICAPKGARDWLAEGGGEVLAGLGLNLAPMQMARDLAVGMRAQLVPSATA